jgi:flagellar hook-associated protein 2
VASASISTTSLSGLGLTGLSSGLDTSGIITKLMAIESQPQTQLKTQLTTLQTHTSALQSLNTAIAAVATTAQSALSANALNSFTTTSSSTAATATASSSAAAGTTQFTVQQLAQTQVSVTDAMADTSTFASSDHSITITNGANTTGVKITAASSSVDDMVSAINTARAGVTASKVAAGVVGGVTQYRLQLTASASGSAAGFSVFTGAGTASSTQLGAASSPALITVTPPQDAQVTLYPNTAAAQTVTSPTNKFSSLTAGLDVTVNATTTSTSPISVTVAADATAAATSAQALTAGLIQVFSGIAASSAITTSSSTSGGTSTSATSGSVFTGDPLVRTVNDALLSAVSGAVDGKSPSSIGINLTKTGTITFDQTAFQAAMASDPVGTTAMYTAIAQRVSDAASSASNAYTGSISQAVTSETSQQSDLSTKVSDWDTRLAAIQAQYETQFNAMEVALNNLSSQSSYLTGQINGLTTNYQGA